MPSQLRCAVCGGAEFRDQPVLWDRLIAEWQLAPEEAAYVDRQQGTQCVACGSSLRANALAMAVVAWGGRPGETLRQVLAGPGAQGWRVLEVNEAAMLTPLLRALPGHVLAEYPAVDMTAMPYADGSFDLVVHSDTLEHVPNPVRALAECRRVLRPGGALCFTVPVIVGRLTRDRTGLPPSYHGNDAVAAADWAVVTEFGADAWTYAIRAGFAAVSIHVAEYPSATAMLGVRTG
jgi:SAM-dependent methyltransferase